MTLENLEGLTVGKYTVEKKLGEGGYGVTYQAKDNIGGKVAIKFIKKYQGSEWKKEAEKAVKVRDIDQIAKVFEIGEDSVTINGKKEDVKYIVWELIEGTPLSDLLQKKKPILSTFIVNLAEQICLGIKGMQVAGLEHGDLHQNNIILVPPKTWDPDKKYKVKIVDFGLARSVRTKFTNDMEYLKSILQTCWECNQFYAGETLVTDKKFQNLLTDLINRMSDTNLERKLSDPIDVIKRIHQIQEQSNDKLSFKEVNLQHPFEYLSVEEMPENSDLVQYLYADNVPWLKEILGFGTTVISGPRGSGKSMILKNMRLLTKLKPSNFTTDSLQELEYLGFYVHCQHNLYFPFAGVGIQLTLQHYDMFVHYLNLIFTAEILDSLITLEELKLLVLSPMSKTQLSDFLKEYVFQDDGSLIFLSSSSILSQCKSLIEKEILLAQKKILRSEVVTKRTAVGYLQNLVAKLDSISEFFRNKRFYFLLDDYSQPKVPSELQKSINRLVGFRNSRFCFKITTERFGFIQEDLDGKILQQDREFSYIDLGARYIKASKPEKKEFIKRIIDKRLDRASLGLTVEKFFGQKPFKGKLADALLKDRIDPTTEKSKLKYAGFDMIYRLCAGDVSTILELCKEIYFNAEDARENLKNGVSAKLQDQIIRDFSERRLNMMKEIPEYGNALYKLVETFGNISKKYLYEYSKANKDSKFLEVLRIELTENTDCLCDAAQKLYRKLITEHIFMDGGGSYPWGKGISNLKLILRPIYTPALKISYSDRYSIKIGCEMFEKFLVKSDEFEKTGSRFLKEVSEKQEVLSLDQFTVSISQDTEEDANE